MQRKEVEQQKIGSQVWLLAAASIDVLVALSCSPAPPEHPQSTTPFHSDQTTEQVTARDHLNWPVLTSADTHPCEAKPPPPDSTTKTPFQPPPHPQHTHTYNINTYFNKSDVEGEN